MKLREIPVQLLTLTCASAFSVAAAEDMHDHNHGTASLVIVTENNPVTVEFTSDLWNLVGFEHVPETPEEAAAMERAQNLLEHDFALLSFNKQAECVLEDVSSNFDDLIDSHAEGADHSGHGGHAEGTDHSDHDGHDGSLEIVVSYAFSCSRADRLRTLTVGHFEKFDFLEEVEAVAFTPDKQLWHKFKPRQARMDLD